MTVISAIIDNVDSTLSAEQTSPPVTAAGPTKHYPALDGLRGVAILAVFFSHFGGGHKFTNPLVHAWSVIADAGWMGVDLFFCLSGFLITGILLDTSQAAHRVRNFYVRRALRIFPLFYGVLLVFLLLTPILHLHWVPAHLLYFFYLGNMVPVVAPHLQSPGASMAVLHLWSLAVEEQFYLLWPFVVWVIRSRVKLLRLSIGIVVAVLILRIALVLHGTDPFIVYSLLFTRADSLIFGSILALLVREPAKRTLPVGWVLSLSAVSVVGLFSIARSSLHESQVISTIGYTAIAVFSTCLVYCAYLDNHWIAVSLNNPVLRFFGRYSYGLYMYHGFLIVVFLPLVVPFQRAFHSAWLGGMFFLLFSLSCTVALAVTSYHLYEYPCLRLKRHFAS